jgi:group I intron endonuclease
MKIIGIYQITSPSGKVYIGQSSNILERWKKYQRLTKNNQPKLENSLNKYGVDNHKFEILTECTLSELDKLEILYKKFIVSKMGWSKTLFCELYDGNQIGPRSEETKRKISESNKGKEVWITGKKHTNKAKAKISKSKKGKPFLQLRNYTKETHIEEKQLFNIP